jgi:hypothetical protein
MWNEVYLLAQTTSVLRKAFAELKAVLLTMWLKTPLTEVCILYT